MLNLNVVPSSIASISVQKADLHSPKLSWNGSIESYRNGPAKGYRIININTSQIIQVNETFATIQNLSVCSNYCFTVTAFNDAGNSTPSAMQCFTTRSPSKIVGLSTQIYF